MIYARGSKSIFHLRLRVPKRYRHVYNRDFFDKSLGTDSPELAAAKAKDVKELFLMRLDALRAGNDADAALWQQKLVEICELRGFRYASASSIASGPLRNILARIEAVDPSEASDAAALLGAGADVGVRMSSLFEHYASEKAVENLEKSASQLHRWGNTPKRAIATFIEAVGDIDFLTMSRDDAARYRQHFSKRIEAGEITAYSANRDIYTLNTACKTVASVKFGVEHSALAAMTFPDKKAARRRRQIGFSEDWVRDKLLAPGAFDRLNDQATDILIAMINTGLRPSEIVTFSEETILLDSNIPHVLVKADGRELKSVSAERIMPLHGVSLEALRRHPNGFPRYKDKAASWSPLVSKYLKRRGMLETEEHRSYSLRHSFADRLADVGCPDRIRDQLMGHREGGTAYGRGASLEALSKWVSKVAI